MSRRSQAPKRTILPDPKFGSELLAKFMNMIMNDGKKSVAERIIYGALDRISEKETHADDKALELLETALEIVKPVVEVKSRRVGGATYRCRSKCDPSVVKRWPCVGLSTQLAIVARSQWRTASPTNCLMQPKIAARQSKRKRTPIVWRKPTRPSRITAGKSVS